MAVIDGTTWFDWQQHQANAVNAASANTAHPMREPTNELDKEAFLMLLITQLQHQDPTNPMDDREFIAQMAQFSALEQMQNMNRSMLQMQAYSMLGKSVEALFACEETGLLELAEGVVESITTRDGRIFLYVNGQDVPMERVQVVHTDGQIRALTNLNNNIVTQQNLALIGRYVQAVEVNSQGEVIGFHEGQIDRVTFAPDGTPLLMMGNVEIRAGNVLSIGNGMRLIGRAIGFERVVDGETVEVMGTVQSITFEDGYPYVNIAYSGGVQRLPIANVGILSEAIEHIGQTVTFGQITGPVTRVIVINRMPHIVVNDIQINFSDFRTYRTAGGTPAGGEDDADDDDVAADDDATVDDDD